MRTLKDSWFIMRSDFRGDTLSMLGRFILSILFMGYLGGMTGTIVNYVLADQDRTLLVDFVFLSLMPLLGFSISRRTMKYWSEDSYTRMLAYLRSLPIPSKVMLARRKLQAVGTLTINGFLFFSIIYWVSDNFRKELSMPSYIAFALTWIGVGLIVSGLYIFIEYLFSGKAYLLITVLIVMVSMGVSLLILLGNGNLFFYSVSYSKEWGLFSPMMWGSLLLGTISVQLFSKWTIYRLQSRDLV